MRRSTALRRTSRFVAILLLGSALTAFISGAAALYSRVELAAHAGVVEDSVLGTWWYEHYPFERPPFSLFNGLRGHFRWSNYTGIGVRSDVLVMEQVSATRLEVGWPFPALRGAKWHAQWFQAPAETRFTHAFPVPRLGQAGHPIFASERILPLQPYWPGFVLNTLILSTAIWVLLGLYRLRHGRHHRNRICCHACGYPLPVSPTCPECGEHNHAA